MANKTQKSALSGRYVLGGKKFAAISAVEGLKLTPVSQARIERGKSLGLSQEERRREIMKAYSVTKSR